MAFWGGSKLFQDVPAYSIVKPFDPTRIDCNAYTLTMGEEYYVTPEMGGSLRANRKRSLKKQADFSQPIQSVRGRGESFVIPPGQFAFLLTEEVVRIPAHLMGFISLKSGIKFKGLINVSGFHVDPGFEGNLIYSVFNAGPSSIHIARGDELFLLWIADVEGQIDKKYYKEPKFPQSEIPNRLISEVAKEVLSLGELSSRIDSLDSKVTIVTTVTAAITAAAALFFTIIAVIPDATFKNLIHFFRG